MLPPCPSHRASIHRPLPVTTPTRGQSPAHRGTAIPGSTLGKSPLAKANNSDVFPQPPSPTMTALISVSVAPGLCPPRSRCMGVSCEATEPVWPRRRQGWGQGGGRRPPGAGCGCHPPAGPARHGAGAAAVTAAGTQVQVSWHTGDLLPAGARGAQASHCHLHVLPALCDASSHSCPPPLACSHPHPTPDPAPHPNPTRALSVQIPLHSSAPTPPGWDPCALPGAPFLPPSLGFIALSIRGRQSPGVEGGTGGGDSLPWPCCHCHPCCHTRAVPC